jgi:hypothetical protein
MIPDTFFCPQVRCGNASTSVFERLLRDRHIDLIQFSTNAEGALLIIEYSQSPPKRTALPTQHVSGCAIRISGVDDCHRLAIGTRCEPPPNWTPAETCGNVECPRCFAQDLCMRGEMTC